MAIPRFVLWVTSGAMMVVSIGITFSQGFPNRPIRLLASAPGGGGDTTARLVARETTSGFGQPVIVENRTAALAIEIVSKAIPDGYTLLVAGSTLITGPLLQKTTYDPVRDFSPVTLVSTSPSLLVVHPSMTASSVKDLIALAKAKPGEVNYATAGIGGSNQLAGELFKLLAGINLTAINYKGGGPAVTAVIGGEVQMMFVNVSTGMQHVKSGRLRALAITSAQPSALVPGLPTVAASGLPGYEFAGLDLLFAPAKTPAAIIDRLNREIVLAVNRPEVKQRLFDTGVEVVGSSPEQLANKLRSEIALWGKVIKDAGIRQD